MASRQHKDNEHRRKIRDSCNSCSSQKIRCGKQRPRCARCATKGLECNYSYSQRTGRRAPLSTSSRSNPTALATSEPPPTPITGEPDPLISIRSMSITPPTPSLIMHGTDAFQLDPFPNDAANPIEDPDDVLQDFNSGMPLDFLWSPSTEDTPSCTALIGTIATAAPMQNLGSMDPYTEPNNRWQSLQDATPATTVPELSTSSTSPDFAQEPAPARTRKPSQPYHHGQDCMALALQVIYDLHVAREHCNTTASDPMTYMQTPREDPRDVDTVLFLNRDAIKSINKVLSCSYCSGDNSILLACYLAASKIVEWYAAAIGLATDGPEEDTGRGNYDSISDDQNHARPMSDRIISRPIFMGRYCLNAEVHRSVRAKVVLSELREHIQPLIGRLPKYHLSSSNLKGTKHGSSISSPLHKDIDGQLCALRNQVRKIIREASNINKHM